ncbi:MAG: hypothetical protein V4772_06535, partial [Pseudomonadota bacterium]
LLDDEDGGDLADLSVRELRNRINELQAKNANLSVEKETVEAERDGALKKLNRRNRDAEEQHVPVVLADIRLEMAALVKKAELAIQSLYPIGVEVVGFAGHEQAGTWVHPTLRLGMSGLVALRMQLDGLIKSYAQAMGENAKDLKSPPDALAFLDDSEIIGLAEDWAGLTALHSHEKALREHEREAAKPRGKGRPSKAPEAPAGVVKGGK